MVQTLGWDTKRTLIDAFETFTKDHAKEPAYTQNSQTISYETLKEKSRRIAAYLMALPGMKKGDRVAIQVPNTLAYPVLAWGIIQAGMVIVNLNPQYSPYETKKQLADSGANVWFCSELSAHMIEEIRREISLTQVIVAPLFALHFWPKRLVFDWIVRRRKKLIRPYSQNDVSDLTTILRQAKSRDWQRPFLAANDLAMLQYTGGSSGTFMGAMLTHANLVANMEQVRSFLSSQGQSAKEVLIAPLPLFHIFSFTVHCAASLLTGSHNILILDATQIKSVAEEMKKYRFTIITGVNTLFYALLRLESFKSINWSDLKFAIAGGMKLDPEVARRFETATGQPILEGFGMTELSPVASWNPKTKNKLGTIGKALPATEMELRSDDGQRITSPNTPGELWVRGPQVMQGYWQREEETRYHKDAEGWMRTGDLAEFDEEHYWKIIGRKKRMILVSGFNVYPSEVEAALKSHPAVLDAKVVGRPHPVNGESVKAYVVSRQGELSMATLRDYLKSFLTPYKIPKSIDFVTELPKEA